MGRALEMTSKRSVRCVAKSTLPPAVLSAPPTAGVRACGCAHRFLPTLPLHSQSAPGTFSLLIFNTVISISRPLVSLEKDY